MGYTHSPLAVFDLETTGIDTKTSRIVSAYIGILDETGNSTQHYEWLVNPGIEIPKQASDVHGITTAYATQNGKDAFTSIQEMLLQLQQIFDDKIPVVAYNAPYDFSLLNYEAKRYSLTPLQDPKPIIDPLVLDKAFDTFRPGKRTLSVVAKHYKVSLESAHDSRCDAITAGHITRALFESFPDLMNMTFDDLHTHQIKWSLQQAQSFEKYMHSIGKHDFVANGAWPLR